MKSLAAFVGQHQVAATLATLFIAAWFDFWRLLFWVPEWIPIAGVEG
jgi:hypothetical protein